MDNGTGYIYLPKFFCPSYERHRSLRFLRCFLSHSDHQTFNITVSSDITIYVRLLLAPIIFPLFRTLNASRMSRTFSSALRGSLL